MLSWSTFQTTTIYDEVLRQVCAMFGIETFQEQQKAIDKFFCLCFVTNWLWKILNISSSASDRSPLLSRSLYLSCQQTFGLFAKGVAKLLN